MPAKTNTTFLLYKTLLPWRCSRVGKNGDEKKYRGKSPYFFAKIYKEQNKCWCIYGFEYENLNKLGEKNPHETFIYAKKTKKTSFICRYSPYIFNMYLLEFLIQLKPVFPLNNGLYFFLLIVSCVNPRYKKKKEK